MAAPWRYEHMRWLYLVGRNEVQGTYQVHHSPWSVTSIFGHVWAPKIDHIEISILMKVQQETVSQNSWVQQWFLRKSSQTVFFQQANDIKRGWYMCIWTFGSTYHRTERFIRPPTTYHIRITELDRLPPPPTIIKLTGLNGSTTSTELLHMTHLHPGTYQFSKGLGSAVARNNIDHIV